MWGYIISTERCIPNGLQGQIAVYHYSTERCNPNGLQGQIVVYHYSTERCNLNGLPFYVFKIIIILPHKKSLYQKK